MLAIEAAEFVDSLAEAIASELSVHDVNDPEKVARQAARGVLQWLYDEGIFEPGEE